MTIEDVIIQKAKSLDIDALKEISKSNNGRKIKGYWEQCASRIESGEITVFIALNDGKPVGYGILNWQPKYRIYQSQNIPEIQDLNILRSMRRKGFARAIIAQCERAATEKKCMQIGISFGLTREYGAAQRLYIKLGYVPDGYGVTYDREPVISGQMHCVDDDLCLMLKKKL